MKKTKCDKCQEEVGGENLYLVPYVYELFLSTEICKDCSMLMHTEFYKFAKTFLECEK